MQRPNKSEAKIIESATEDVRFWQPGETKEVNISAGLDKGMPTGQYQIFLNLPAPSGRLLSRPEYSIRLANKDVWKQSKGYNSLQQSVNVCGEGSSYSGSLILQGAVGKLFKLLPK